MEALGASHLKFFVGRQREKERVALSRKEFGCVVHQKLVLFRANCVGSVSSTSSSPSQTNLGNEAIQSLNLDKPKTVRVRFKLHKECAFGQQFLVVGDDPSLGLWEPSDGVPLNWSEGHVWTADVDVPCSKVVSYKFILEGIGGTLSWQPGPDRVLETWDTDKTISVFEDWDSPDLKNVVEEEPGVVDGVNESSLDDPGVLIGEHWDQTDDSSDEEEVCDEISSLGKGVVEEGNDVMKEEVCGEISNLGKGVVEEGNDVVKEEIDGDEDERTSSDHSDEPLLLMVAENISLEQDLGVSDEGLGEENEETTLGDRGGSDDSSRLENETRVVRDEGVPVLVMGLATSPPEEVEEAESETSSVERSITDVSDEIFEVTTTDEIEDSTDFNNSKVVVNAATESDDLSTLENETRVVRDEGVPVLVMGLATSPTEEIEEAEVEAESETSSVERSITDVSDEIFEVTTTDEIEDSTDFNNSKVVVNAATESDEIEDSADLNPRKDNVVTESDANEAATEAEIPVSATLHRVEASEMTALEEKPPLNGEKKQILDKKRDNVVEDIATESDQIEDSADLNPRNNNLDANEAEIPVSAEVHRAEASEVTEEEEEQPRRNGVKKQILDNDMQWGRRALHKFLANLGFMQHR